MACWGVSQKNPTELDSSISTQEERESQGSSLKQLVKFNNTNGSQIYVTFMKSIVLDSAKWLEEQDPIQM